MNALQALTAAVTIADHIRYANDDLSFVALIKVDFGIHVRLRNNDATPPYEWDAYLPYLPPFNFGEIDGLVQAVLGSIDLGDLK